MNNVKLQIVLSVVEVNEGRKARIADKVRDALDGSLEGKRIAVLGLILTPKTDDMRNALSSTIIPQARRAFEVAMDRTDETCAAGYKNDSLFTGL